MELHQYESLAERRIRDAIEHGEFDDLPGSGAPIPGIERPYDATWWARRFAERDRARTAVHETAAAVERALGAVWTLPDEAAVRRVVGRLNHRLETANASVAAVDRVDPIDPEWAVDVWRRMSPARRRREAPPAGS